MTILPSSKDWQGRRAHTCGHIAFNIILQFALQMSFRILHESTHFCKPPDKCQSEAFKTVAAASASDFYWWAGIMQDFCTGRTKDEGRGPPAGQSTRTGRLYLERNSAILLHAIAKICLRLDEMDLQDKKDIFWSNNIKHYKANDIQVKW